MEYRGKRLKEYTSDEFVTFDPPVRMLVWDTDADELTDRNIVLVDQFNPVCRLPVRTIYGAGYEHCAPVPGMASDRLATERELVLWLASGKGDMEVQDGHTMVRKYGHRVWHEPTVGYLGLGLTDLQH